MNTSANRRILLIDDTPAIHEDFRKILTRPAHAPSLDATEEALFGRALAADSANAFELDSAYGGQEGAALVEAAIRSGRPYALAFVDMRMPQGWDGVETIERLWRIDPELQVVICTAYSDNPWVEVMGRLQAGDRLLVIKKPFDVIEVSQLARSLTAKWEATRQAALQIQRLDRAVAELKASEAAARQSHAELQMLAHSLSHDLRAPLTAMSSFSQLLAAELGDTHSGKALHYLSRIRANAESAELLINGLLVLDGVSRAQLHPEPTDIGAVAREALDELRRTDPQREVAIDVREGLWANADRALLRLALRNLLANAWRFTAQQAQARIEVGRQDGGEDAFFVRDNGRGFDMAYAGQLFVTPQRFHRDTAQSGTGIGLIVVSRIVGRHGGRVWAEATPGGGAAFYFTLPPARTTPAAT